MAEAVMLVVTLLAIGFIATRLSEWLKLPHSVFLVVLGLVAGWGIRSLNPQLIEPLTAEFPEIILYVLLPPLIFESAYNIDLKALQRDLVPVSALAVVGLILSTILVGFGMHWGLSIAIIPALLFGALISATDPVAVVALFKEVGAPKRLNLLVEGESLFNDGTAIVAFTALLGLLSVDTITGDYLGQALLRFFVVFFGGVAVGAVLAVILAPFVQLCRNGTAQIGLTIFGAYASFIIADHFLHLSGVMSTVALGLFMGTRARLEFNREALHGMGHMWELMALSANTLVFIAVGLTVDMALLFKSIEFIPITLLIVILARAVAIVAVVPLLNQFKLCQPVSASYQFIMFWGGLRGGLALALVLLLPDTLAEKPLFLALATSVVLATLLVNALTIGPALRWLGIDRLTAEEQSVFRHSLAKLWQSIYHGLHHDTKGGLLSPQVVERFVRQSAPLTRSQQKRQAKDLEDDLRIGLRSALLSEGLFYEIQMEDGLLGKAVYLDLKHFTQERLDVLDRKGPNALAMTRLTLIPVDRPWDASLEKLSPSLYVRVKEKRLTRLLNALFHLERGLHHVMDHLEDDSVRSYLERESSLIYLQYTQLCQAYPHLLFQVQGDFIARSLGLQTERWLDRSYKSGLITRAVYNKVAEAVVEQEDKAMQMLQRFQHPSPSDLIAQATAFHHLTPQDVEVLAANTKTRNLHTGEVPKLGGDMHEGFLVVKSGMYEHVQATKDHRRHAHFITGDAVDCQREVGMLKTVVPGEILLVDRPPGG